MTDLTPQEATEQLTLEDLEELALKHMVSDVHVVRHRGQVEVAREMRAMAFSNIADLLYEDVDGVLKLRKLSELPREVTAAVKKIKLKRDRVRGPRTITEEGDVESEHVDMTGEVVEIELWDKNAPLDKLMRHYGGYALDNAQTKPGGERDHGVDLDQLMGAIAQRGVPEPTPPALDFEGEEEI
jgi:hypothetical protein